MIYFERRGRRRKPWQNDETGGPIARSRRSNRSSCSITASPQSGIIREYALTASAFDKWVKRINATGSNHDKDNRTPEERELLRLRKENQRLRMENEVLKQAALIFARK
ncbi:MAG: hypothetical protein VB067_07445 [Christensenellaceae bacterium]|nr:hypothetical protein [Christensenellaceae bacterium]MEA5068803.1 hypothetical protein [Christensenellaceae bacterium]